ncbi:hypothetical protein [Pseudonocardia sp. H11422]|uniref:hypothetical protein n=1 Tax=Pseudonocardia sp. H11422 TaxID=2835866 RepID=UPI001BDC0F93|nr:hypothetical protein [Pseudonocardia sp. H11422]
MSTTARRVVAVSAMSVPLAFAATGFAHAGDGGPGKTEQPRHCSGGSAAVQDGGLLGLGADVSPALNVGGLLNSGPVTQQSAQVDQSNSGIVQQGGGCGGGSEAFQAGDLVDAALEVSPALNIGGIGNSGPVNQSTVQVDRSNSGIVQQGGGHGGHGGFAAQDGGLLGLDLDLSPTINLGGILSSGAVNQSSVHHDGSNSGISQS